MDEEKIDLEKFDKIHPEIIINQENYNFSKSKEIPKKKNCHFPSAYTILIILEFIVFIFIYIIPKGKFHTIEYDSNKNVFIINIYNITSNPALVILEGNQKTLDNLKMNIKFENFKLGYIKKPIAIPNTYTRLDNEENLNFFKLFSFPIYGLINSSDIGFVLMMIGGCLNLLKEMNSLSSGIEVLSEASKGHEFILMICIFLLISIGATTLGIAEEILSFYPILMPIFLKNGLDGALAGASLYFGSIIGTMFSTLNPFAVVIASYSAGINFIDGVIFRVIGFVIGDIITIGYFIYYHKKIKANPQKSAIFDIKNEIYGKFLIKKEKNINKTNLNNTNDETAQLKKKKNKQKISLILFGFSFIILIIGVITLDWWFEQIASIFLILGIVLIFLAGKGEQKGMEIFIKGAGDFVGVILIIGLARGISITLEKGLILDTILNYLSNLVDGLPKIIFCLTMFIVFIILGIFIQSSSGLAVLSMPVFAPLADKAHCPRKIVVNAYMLGQNFISFLSPTGLTLIILQLIGMKYTHWLKFCWPFVIMLFILLVIMIILDLIFE